jgi:predicted ATPase
MEFLLRRLNGPWPAIVRYPAAVLSQSNWDDYGYKTMFGVTLALSPEDSHDLGNVKILGEDQTGGYTELPSDRFEQLGARYCSLGQSYSYYETLATVDPAIRAQFLEGLSDVVVDPSVRARFQSAPGFETSLLRFDTARRALEDAPQLFDGTSQADRLTPLEFIYKFPESDAAVTFGFGTPPELPTRLSIVIGYNGAGKTRLLANLGQLTYADRDKAAKEDFIDLYGEYVGERPQFGSIVAVSYSAFDNFALPKSDDGEQSHRAEERSYTYCGLRASTEAEGVSRLKDVAELTSEFETARQRALAQARNELLAKATAAIFAEPSFRTTAETPDIDDPAARWDETFDQLSSGHKIVLHIIVQLCAYLEPRSLVLLDEPELHLHPPLIAALLRGVGDALDYYNSYAVVATHSPVVLQEVPASNVKVLRRSFGELAVEEPAFETFAENVGVLTREVFSLDSSDTDYQAVLRELATTRTLEQVESLFPNGLSSQASSLVMSLRPVGRVMRSIAVPTAIDPRASYESISTSRRALTTRVALADASDTVFNAYTNYHGDPDSLVALTPASSHARRPRSTGPRLPS